MAKSAIQTFGKYQILERIATGGTAEIYKAKLEGIGGFQRTFAIKRILPNLSQHSDYIAMLVDEAKVAGLLSHANIVQILDLGQVDGIWYIAMEYVDGRDLGAVLRRANRKGLCLPVPHAVFIAIELLKGLEYAHQRQVMRGGKAVPLNIIHRDISPPNVLMSFQGEVKLTDFGIARASLKMMETVSGIVKGRFDYMSPEQAEGRKDLDQRSDLFSVGVVLYEMLTGVHPFRAESELGTVERVRTGKYTAVSTRNPEVPFALQTIVDRALQVDRDKRYPSATAFKEALDRFFHEAGFIFTHATLATYVKGLFPESAKKKRAPGTPTGDPGREVSAGPAIDGLDPDRTGVMDFPRNGPTPSGGMGREDLEATAIRPNPLAQAHASPEPLTNPSSPRISGSGLHRHPVPTPPTPTGGYATQGFDTAVDPTTVADEQETLVHRDFMDEPGDEVATVIRTSPFDDAALEAAPPQYPAHGDDALRSGVRPYPDDPGSYTGALPITTRPSLIGWLGVVLSVICLLVGIFLGSVLGTGGAFLFGVGAGAGEALPVVRVLAQRDVEVLLDGKPAKRNFTIPPDEQKSLEVRAEGQRWSIPLKMAPGEVRVFIIQVPSPDAP
ncbi:MAG: serine/threonine-protein kinase [Myxococcota bacterium]